MTKSPISLIKMLFVAVFDAFADMWLVSYMNNLHCPKPSPLGEGGGEAVG